MKTFKDLVFESHSLGGIKATEQFSNGYGISIIKTWFSHGNEHGLYEIAVLNKNGEITYKTEITSDVIGYLTESDVSDIMIRIQNLK